MSTYTDAFALTGTLVDDETCTDSGLRYLDEVNADGEVVSYIGCAQSARHAREVARREATERRIPLGRIAISRGAS